MFTDYGFWHQGIYPTVIIVLVCLRMTCHDNMIRAMSRSMQFETRPIVLSQFRDFTSTSSDTQPTAPEIRGIANIHGYATPENVHETRRLGDASSGKAACSVGVV